MNTRLQQIIAYKTNGKLKPFATLMGWTPQYLSRLVKGQSSIGIAPVTRLVKLIPELNARWLITGEGEMLTPNTRNVLLSALALEKYMPVMTAEEQQQLVSGDLRFDLSTIHRWEVLLEERHTQLADIFSQAYARQNASPCSTPTAN